MKLVAVVLVFLLSAGQLFSQTIEDVMESYWSGASRARSEATESGYFYCSQYLYDVEYNSYDDTFEGTLKTVFNLDGTDYISKWTVSGSVNTTDFSVTIRPLYMLREDELPGGLYWIGDNVYLQLYNDADHEGYFLMSGQSSSMEYSDETFELGTY
ncbi:MAG: hypothetical protein C0592_03515 [Marinilabiliales bacterium]|nr:MAG: hypothetical protein C0592_03515 [Marinilabiliales bacterium]